MEEAVDRGELDPGRLQSFRSLQRETEALARRRDERSRREAERKQGKLYKRIQSEKRRQKGDITGNDG